MTAEELGQMIWNVKELLRNVYDNKDVEDVILPISRKTKCSAFTKHFVPESHLLTQIKM